MWKYVFSFKALLLFEKGLLYKHAFLIYYDYRRFYQNRTISNKTLWAPYCCILQTKGDGSLVIEAKDKTIL